MNGINGINEIIGDYSKPTLARLDERLAGIVTPHSYQRLDQADFDAFLDLPGMALVLFAEDPARVPETWDVAVILADMLKRIALPLRVGLLPVESARPLAQRYGITLWPSLLVLRDGGYVGAVEGMLDWSVFQSRLTELLDAPARRPPGIVIPVQASHACH